jgi:hypothetical protein
MLLHRGAWNDNRYLLMKTDALARDHRTQRFDWYSLCTIMPAHFFVLLICDARPTEAILAFLF